MGFEIPFIGLLISLAFTALTGVYPGGIIVPSYLVLFMNEPARIAGTLIAALLTMGVYRLSCRWLILFGRRRFVFLILVGGILAFLWRQFFPAIFPASLEFRVIGWVIPGLIASHLERQGVAVTAAALVTVTVLTGWLGLMLNLL
ncbi:MAG: poly-gamma-glutamate biosynthesis protein PgsC [Gemmatimonadetes bacterium]|nr:poly-gamma-glutamate biosynthesis protein PgsC [Gemmatimonadota bacterium]NIO32267.1 poly-gamma-glutamate biosynthesis protein PgsC [Gemmatimonadota bacterium]